MISSKFRNNKKNKEQDKEKMEKILSEYKIQLTNFNPNNRSPNIFMNNLKRRMDSYYKMILSNSV